MDKLVKIAVIDSGISQQYFNIPIINFKLVEKKDGNFNFTQKDGDDCAGHGNAVTKLILDYTSKVIIYNFKIFDTNHEITCKRLIYTLQYIYQYLNIDIINISAGVTYIDSTDYQELKKVCNKLRNKNTLVISAFDNHGAVSFPAALDSVIGVDTTTLDDKNDLVEVKNSMVNLLVKNQYFRTIWLHGERAIIQGVSFACAKVTGLISNYIQRTGNKSIRQIFEDICNKTIECDRPHSIQKPKFQIKKAILFPVNKESLSILRFQDLINFKLINVYDEKLSGKVGKNILGYPILSYNNINWEEDFDTIILSCFSELSNITHNNYKEQIIKKAQQYNKQIYSFENLGQKNSASYFWPEIKKIWFQKTHLIN